MSHLIFRHAQPGVSRRILLMALALFCPAAVAQTTLQCGTPVSGQFTSAGQIDRYTIAVNAGDVMAIRATNGYMELYDPVGRVVSTARASSRSSPRSARGHSAPA